MIERSVKGNINIFLYPNLLKKVQKFIKIQMVELINHTVHNTITELICAQFKSYYPSKQNPNYNFNKKLKLYSLKDEFNKLNKLSRFFWFESQVKRYREISQCIFKILIIIICQSSVIIGFPPGRIYFYRLI